MKPRDRKLAILRQLSQEAEPFTLAELVDKLELDYTDRTVRRYLNELITEGWVEKCGKTRGVTYRAIQGQSRSQTEELPLDQISSCFGSESLRAIKKISQPLFDRQPVTYKLGWFEAYRPNETFYLPACQRKQLQQAGKRANGQDPAGTYARQIFNRLLIDLSYNSSRLEGNTYSLLDTERLLLHGEGAEGKLDEERVMILNHTEAIRYLVDNASRLVVSRNVICTLHYLLADALVEPKYAGKVRDHGVRIGGSVYLPFEDPKQLEQQLERVAEKASLIRDPFEQSFFLLVHLSYLQAFADVNKRTARLSANISLIKENVVPLAFNDVEVKDYMSAMIAIYELQDIWPLADLYLYSYMRTCAAYDATVRSLGFDAVRVRYRQQRRAIVREVILGGLGGRAVRERIIAEAERRVPEADRQAFVDNALEDLDQIDESRLAGLGVTPEELTQWLQCNREGWKRD